jgi:hypothetical protein
MRLDWLTPVAALIGLAVLLLVAAFALRERRAARVRRELGLAAPSRASRAVTVVPGIVVVALLAAAAAQPAVRVARTESVRADAELFFVLDVSGSMRAARTAKGETRFARAVTAAEEIRGQLSNVPAGIASLSNRPLPHLFPTPDAAVFSSTLRGALGIGDPRPQPPVIAIEQRTTRLDTLPQVAEAAYFSPTAKRRLLVLLTDGESTPYEPGDVASMLAEQHIAVLAVQVWHADERVFRRGRAVRDYRPDPAARAPLRRLAAATGGGLYTESETGAVVRRAHRLLGTGPTASVTRGEHEYALAPFLALAAIVPLALALVLRDPRSGRMRG